MTWLRGTEHDLIREVADYMLESIAPPSSGYAVLFAGETPEPDVWSACMQYPPPGQARLTVVHEAGQLTQAAKMSEVCEAVASITGAHVLFTGEGFEDGQAEVQHSPRGRVINCSFSQDEERAQRDKAAWVAVRLGGDGVLAREVLELVDYDFSAAAAVCDKVQRCGFGPGYARALASWHGTPPFTDSLVLGERQVALRAAEVLDPDEIGFVIGQLSARLGVMSALYWAVQDGAGGRELHKAADGVPAFLVSRFRKAVPQYSPQRIREQRQLLDVVDSAYLSGIREGVLEALCAGW